MMTDDTHHVVSEIICSFLRRSMMENDLDPTPPLIRDDQLYEDILKEVKTLIGEENNSTTVEKISRTACDLAHITYSHTSAQHQHYIALYTVCFLYADDLGIRHLSALVQFTRRFTLGEKQLTPALEQLANLMRQSYNLWPQVGADAIVSGTLEAISAMHVEYTSGANMKVLPQASLWPNYFRNRSGICPPYAHFNFMKSWRSSPESYLQLLPYLEFYIVAANDVLSFYKEQLVGEKNNYIHIRATTDQVTPESMLRLVANEVVDCGAKIKLLIGSDVELMDIWRSFEQGVLEFHLRTQRYRLAELTYRG